MTTRHRVIAAACIGAFVLVIVPFIWGSWQPAPQPLPAPMPIHHGKFADRLQPKLDGIGSTRELAPVPPDGAPSPHKREPSHPRRGQDR